jgi:hypothetical protein
MKKMTESFIIRKEEDTQCCPLLCFPSYQKPHNILRTTNLFDAFMVGLVVVPTIVDLSDKSLLLPRIIILLSSMAMFVHSLWMVMYYNKFVSNGKLLERANLYSKLRL